MSPHRYDGTHNIAHDVEDLEAVLDATGASRVFGLSSGALIALEAAQTLPQVARVAVYEPPFYADDGICRERVVQLHAEIEEGDLASALVTAVRLAGTASGPLRVLPRPVARLLARAAMGARDDEAAVGGRLRDLIPSLRYDFDVVASVDAQTFATLDKPMLGLSGSKSPGFLRHGTQGLVESISQARFVELAGLGHSGPWNVRDGGRPAIVGPVLQEFMA